MRMKRPALLILVLISILITGNRPYAGDAEIFSTSIPPDTLILLDLSGSMNWDPSGNVAAYPDRKIDMARKAIFAVLDHNADRKIDADDEKNLNIRFGYMRFWDSSSNDDVNPLTGTIRVQSPMGSSYNILWESINVRAEYDGLGSTPLAAALAEAKTYFLNHVNPRDAAISCRQKFVILITDGGDTCACNGDGTETQSNMFQRRILTVRKSKELYDAGIRVFFVGFGATMPEEFKRTLNWAAKYGGTDNPTEMNSGDPSIYNVMKYDDACTTTDTDADPAKYPLSGYAFFAQDTSYLGEALATIAKNIQGKSYSFTDPVIASSQIIDKGVVYISSFIPDDAPLWKGNFKAYQLNQDGILPVDKDGNPLDSNLLWDASEKLAGLTPNSRILFTSLGNAQKNFEYDFLTNADLAVASDSERTKVISYTRGTDSYDLDQDGNTTEGREWKLGDIFHSNGVVVGEPSQWYEEECFDKCSSEKSSFYQEKRERTKIVIVGANDGMLHAFDAATGDEKWGFIPNNVLKNLKRMISTHTFYVDSSPKVADVWFYSNPFDATKSTDEWRTILVCGLRKGGKQYFALDITDTLNPVFL